MLLFYLVSLIIIFLIIEFSLQLVVNFLRKYFDNSHEWLKNRYITNIITKEKDQFPKIQKKKLLQFKLYMYDLKLGSLYKKNTNVVEKFFKNKKIYKSNYSIDNDGSRFNRYFKKKSKISTYGDSIAFCRYVNDNDTWQVNLSKKIKSNVKNFGVGNYGLDQSFLRYLENEKNKKEKSKTVIFAVGPETIRRNMSLWKHYFEFGNIFNFKPAFIFNKKNKEYIFYKNPLTKLNENLKLVNIHKKIKKKDFFYRNKFQKYLWTKPYSFSLFINTRRKIILILFFFLKYIQIEKKSIFANFLIKKYFKKFDLLGGLYFDFIDKEKYYNDDKIINNTIQLIKKIKKETQKNKKNFVLLLIPSHYDYVHRKKNKYCYYSSLINKANKITKCIDIGEHIKEDPNKIFADRGYGAHYNKRGNKIISKIIFHFINKNLI